jgi:predicted nucleic acid-binding protein
MTASMVLDCSIAVSWCFEDEKSQATDALLEKLRDEGALVPALWYWEVANVLAIAVRRGRVEPSLAQVRFALLQALPVRMDAEATGRAWRETFQLAVAHRLTAYDAAYLELAQRTGLELASKDAELCAAAAALGIKLAL